MSKFLSWIKGITLNSADDWEDYAGRMESVVSALDLEDCFRVPVRRGGDIKDRTVLDATDPHSAQPQEVLELTDDEWKTYLDTKTQKDLKASHKQAHTMIVLTVGKAYSHLTRIRKHAGYTWARLRIQFEGTSRVRLLTLYRNLFTTTIRDFDDDFTRYSSCIENLSSKLAGLGKSPDDALLIIAMLLGLPEDRFGNIIEIIFQSDNISFSQATARIQSHVDRVTTNDSKHSEKLLTMDDRRSSRSDWKKNVKCHHCGIKGHLKSECRKLKRLLEKRKNGKDRPRNKSQNRSDVNNHLTDDHDAVDTKSQPENDRTRIPDARNDDWDELWNVQDSPQRPLNTALIDNGCTRHVTSRSDIFATFKPEKGRTMTGLGGTARSLGTGTVRIQTSQGVLELHDVAYIPSAKGTFIAERKLVTQDGYHLQTDHKNGIITICDTSKNIIARSDPRLHTSLHVIRFQKFIKNRQGHVRAMSDTDAIQKLHLGLCHQSHTVIRKTLKAIVGVPSLKFPAPDVKVPPCDPCMTIKSKRRPFKKKLRTGPNPQGLTIHLDLKTTLTPSIDGHRHYVTMITEDERFVAAAPLRSKHVFHHYTTFVRQLEAKTGKKVIKFKSDCGGEFMNHRIRNWNNQRGIESHYCPPYTPETNGLAERTIQWLHKAVKVILKQCGLPIRYWNWALRYSVWVRNRLVNSFNPDKTPYELLLNKKPSLKHLHPFGCIGYRVLPRSRRPQGGFADAGQRCRMLGYDKESNWFWVLTPDRKIIKTTNVKFFDLHFRFPESQPATPTFNPLEAIKPSGGADSKINQEFNTPDQAQDSKVPQLDLKMPPSDVKTSSVTPRNLMNDFTAPPTSPVTPTPEHSDHKLDVKQSRSTSLAHKAPKSSLSSLGKPPDDSPEQTRPLRPRRNSSKNDNAFILHQHPDHLFSMNEPGSYKEAKAQGDRWDKPMEEEISALERNKTWTIVRREKWMNVISCRWTYKEKVNKSNVVCRLKARLVARGFQQRGVSFNAKFSPTVRQESIRLLIALAATKGWTLTTCDVNNAFLHGFLHEPVYMSIPEGLRDKYDPKLYCCKLNRGLYGLQVSARAWNEELNDFLISLGFTRCISDPCVYTLKHDLGEMILCVYVDDLIIGSSHDNELSKMIVDKISKKYGIKEYQPLDYVLGMEVIQQQNHILLSQKSYIQRLLNKHNMDKCHGVCTPMNPNVQIDRDSDGEPADETLYRSIIGGLAYCMTCTRPDIAFAVSKLSRYLNKPTKNHLLAAQHLLRYLKHTQDYCLRFPKDACDNIDIWVDADLGGCNDTRRSTSGRIILYNGCPVTWKSKRQSVPAKSTAEAEYISLSEAITDAIWLKNLADEMDFKVKDPQIIHEDNQACIQIAENPVITQRSKGIDIKYHHARHHVQSGKFKIVKAQSDDQLADICTKALNPKKLTPHIDRLFSRSKANINPD